jgi:hypothetical protein
MQIYTSQESWPGKECIILSKYFALSIALIKLFMLLIVLSCKQLNQNARQTAHNLCCRKALHLEIERTEQNLPNSVPPKLGVQCGPITNSLKNLEEKNMHCEESAELVQTA